MFSGEWGSRKKVDLRGASRETDRAKLLEKTRLDRERRARERLEARSAAFIQACFRGYRVRVAVRKRVRDQWLATYGAGGEKVSRESLDARGGYFAGLMYFARLGLPEDLQILTQCCRLILKTQAEGGGLYFFKQAEDPGQRPVVVQRAMKLADACFVMLRRNWAELKGGAGVALLAFLLQVCTPGVWGATPPTALAPGDMDTSGDGDPADWGRVACQGLMAALEARGFFGALIGMVHSVLPPLSGGGAGGAPAAPAGGVTIDEVAAAIVGRYIDLRVDAGVPPERSLDFSVRLLTTPSLWERAPAFRRSSPGLWRHALAACAGALDGLPAALARVPPGQYQPGACLLGNLLQAAGAGLESAGAEAPSLALQLARVAECLLVALPAGAFPKRKRDLMYEEDEDEDMAPADEGGPGGGGSWGEPPAGVRRQLEMVGDGRLLRAMVRICMPREGEAGAGTAAAGGGGEAAALCALLHVALTRLPGQRARVVGALAYAGDLVPRLWRFLRACHVAGVWPAPAAGGGGGAAAAAPGWLLPLAVFSPVASYLLETTDDEEFFDEERPFARADIPVLIDILRGALWKLVWSDQAPGMPAPSPEGADLRSQGTQWMGFLLQQLHDRNFRRRAVHEEAFHAPALPAERLLVETLDGAPRAKELLRVAPALVPFKWRVRIFQELVAHDKDTVQGPHGFLLGRESHKVTIRRDFLVSDGFAQLDPLGAELKARVRINFINELGAPEAGVDGGGLFKDFLDTLCKTVFDSQYGLFMETSEHQLYPNPGSALVMDDHLRYCEFLGRVLGKALYEGILLELPFANFFLSKLRGRNSTLNDLPSLDLELHKHLRFLKNYEGDVESLCLFFVATSNEFGQSEEVELLPGGRDIPVTSENRVRYIALMANHRLNTQIRAQAAAFVRGLHDLVEPQWLRMFNEPELQVLISGTAQERIDLGDLRAHTNYSGGYHEDHPVIRMLWESVEELDPPQQRAFLKFVTSCSRAPLLGFKYLEPKFAVHRSGAAATEAPDETADVERLPTSATCMNLLKLPPYPDKSVLRSKLAYAISSGAGFDLS